MTYTPNPEPMYRSFVDLGSDIEIRSAKNGERIVTGIAVPYNRPTRIDRSLVESFAAGSFRAQVKNPSRIPLAREHLPLGGSLIGRVTLLRDDAAGLYTEARISPTALGDETLALIEDGALDSFSIGFREGQNKRQGDGTILRLSAHMTELAVVMKPAYEGARVLATRSEDEELELVEPTRERAAQASALLISLPLLPALPRPR